MGLVEFILAEDAMQDPVSVIRVCDPFKEVENWGDYGHMCSEKELIIRYHRREATWDKEKQMNDHQQDCSVYEFIQDNSQPSMQNSSMLEK